MKYSNKNAVMYKGISKEEVYLLSRAEFEKQKLIDRDFVLKLFKDSRKIDNLLNRLRRKGRLLQIERGKYLIVPIKAPNQLWAPNEFVTSKILDGRDTVLYRIFHNV